MHATGTSTWKQLCRCQVEVRPAKPGGSPVEPSERGFTGLTQGVQPDAQRPLARPHAAQPRVAPLARAACLRRRSRRVSGVVARLAAGGREALLQGLRIGCCNALRQHLHQVSPGPSSQVVSVWPWGVFHGCARSVTRARGQCLPHLSVAGAALLHAVLQDVQIKFRACVYGLCVGVQWSLSGHEGA